jgi:hypothetical protein
VFELPPLMLDPYIFTSRECNHRKVYNALTRVRDGAHLMLASGGRGLVRWTYHICRNGLDVKTARPGAKKLGSEHGRGEYALRVLGLDAMSWLLVFCEFIGWLVLVIG